MAEHTVILTDDEIVLIQWGLTRLSRDKCITFEGGLECTTLRDSKFNIDIGNDNARQ